MAYFLLAFGSFIFFILSHAIAYRLRFIQFENWKLILLSFVWAAVYLILAETVNNALGMKLEWSSFVCYWLFVLWYLGEMTTVQYNSPSIKILKALLRHPNKKITAHEVESLFTDQELVIERLDDLVLNGHVKREGNLFKAQPRGKLIAVIFKIYRSILGRGPGG